MRWEDERYVRVYTRDTADWNALSWDAQSLFMHLLRKVDRAGLMPLGRHGRRGVALALNQTAIWDRLAPALDELLEDGCVQVDEETLLIPNFLVAQETRSSDAQRKRDQRERASVRSTPPSSHQLSPDVTSGHQPSPTVTNGHSMPCRAVPSHAVPSQTPPSPSPGGASADADPELQLVADFVRDVPDPDLGELAEAWNEITAPPLPRVTAMPKDRKKRAQAARKRRPMAEWREVFRRVQASSFCRGEDGGWKADFDWAIRPGGTKPEPAQRLLEGAFDRTGPPGVRDVKRGAVRAEDMAAAHRDAPVGVVTDF